MAPEFFPFNAVRPVQKDCMQLVRRCISEKNHLVMHAPTGLGKTAATLVPAIEYSLENSKTVFFLTSRNTQHCIAVETVNLVKQKSGEQFTAVDILGRQWMCCFENAAFFSSSEFSNFCKSLREQGACTYFENAREFKPQGLACMHAEQLISFCAVRELCPFEIASKLAAKAAVIIADYHYLFHPSINKTFLARSKKKLEDCIIIVDEAHNLPSRIRNTLSSRISTISLDRASRESQRYAPSVEPYLRAVKTALLGLSGNIRGESLVQKDSLVRSVGSSGFFEEVLEELSLAGEAIREKQHLSFIARVADFLETWQGPDQSFVRILECLDSRVQLSYHCLDPSVAAGSVIKDSHCTVIMSGTLTPTFMYRDLLGFPKNTLEASFQSPFPKENLLAMIVPSVTTKYKSRNEAQFENIGRVCSDIIGLVPGNLAIFFPSYMLLEMIRPYLLSGKQLFVESSSQTKADRRKLIDSFCANSSKGGVLLGVSTGSFGEGIDLPGELLNAVLVVGMPFASPDLEAKELIKYFDQKFGKGWDYGYILPTIARTLQNAGRCIRSETDRGVVAYLDSRYTQYLRCFPPDAMPKLCTDYKKRIAEFFCK
ncbi:MAG: ATP-dependent DNA helicase [Candidatus Woesearchaeota archaeon]